VEFTGVDLVSGATVVGGAVEREEDELPCSGAEKMLADGVQAQ
jgi:hypothetical protein